MIVGRLAPFRTVVMGHPNTTRHWIITTNESWTLTVKRRLYSVGTTTTRVSARIRKVRPVSRHCHRVYPCIGASTLVQPMSRRRLVSTSSTVLGTMEQDPPPAWTCLKDGDMIDVVIVGGGVVGAAMAQQLVVVLSQKKNSTMPLSIALLEQGPGPNLTSSSSSDNNHDNRIPHPRSYALSPTSLQLLGLDSNDDNDTSFTSSRNNKDWIGYYDSMQVWEVQQPATLLLDAKRDLSSPHAAYLGAVCEDSFLVRHLWNELTDQQQQQQQQQDPTTNDLHLWTNTHVKSVEWPTSTQAGMTQVTLGSSSQKDGSTKTIQTRLLIGADGGNSHIRQLAGITNCIESSYNQTALTFTVELDRPMTVGGSGKRRAYQRFLSTGPIGFLPTYSDRHAIVVWSTTPEIVQYWKDQYNTTDNGTETNRDSLVRHLNELLQEGPGSLPSMFGHANTSESALGPSLVYGINKLMETIHYGAAMGAQELTGPFHAPPLITDIASPQLLSFPLQRKQASKYTSPRMALIGDAAHTVHPMAGQGLNLGLLDVQNLAQVVDKAVSSGMDPATFLNEYEHSRQVQVSMTVQGIHALHGLFGEQHVLAKHAKSLGMSLIQSVTPLRQVMVQAACHGVAIP